MRCSHARAGPSSPRPASVSCPIGRAWISPAGPRRTFSRIREPRPRLNRVPRRGHIPRPFCPARAAAYDRGLIPRLDRGAKRLTAATAAERSEGWTASSRSDLSHAFRVARRYSRWVRLLRIAIPTLVVLLVLGFAAATWFNPLRIVAKLPNAAGTLTISGTKITMELPRIAGYTRDARAYELSAQSADQDLTRPAHVELKGIAPRVELQK